LHKIGSALSSTTHDILTMGKTILLGTTLAVVFAVFMIVPALAGGHVFIDEAEVDDNEVEIEATADIPTDGTGGDFGYGAFTTDGDVVVVTSHAGIGDDSVTQEADDDPAFHTHLVELTDTPDECPSGDDLFAIADIPSMEAEIADFEIDEDEVEIFNIDEELSGVVVSFVLSLDPVDFEEVCVEVKSLIDAGDDDDD